VAADSTKSAGSGHPYPAAFELTSVSVGTANQPILRDINVSTPVEGILAVAGPSGAGKSTFLRLLNRLDDPVAGTVKLAGLDLRDWDPATLRRHVAMVFQRAPVFAGTVLDNLRVADPQVTDDRARHVLDHVALPTELLDRPADRLSGGEAQRMSIARALLTAPEILLADEPTAALDGDARRAVEDLGREIADGGVPIVWITHDTYQLRRLADHVLLLADGELLAFGRLDELDEHPDPLVRSLVGADKPTPTDGAPL